MGVPQTARRRATEASVNATTPTPPSPSPSVRSLRYLRVAAAAKRAGGRPVPALIGVPGTSAREGTRGIAAAGSRANLQWSAKNQAAVDRKLLQVFSRTGY